MHVEEKQKVAMFVSFCIEQYAQAKHKSTIDIAKLFEQYGISEHLSEYYDVLHTQGRNWLIEEIDEMINKQRFRI